MGLDSTLGVGSLLRYYAQGASGADVLCRRAYHWSSLKGKKISIKGLFSTQVGYLLVFIFMIIFYRLFMSLLTLR